jgi:hypothetical protein
LRQKSLGVGQEQMEMMKNLDNVNKWTLILQERYF